MESETRYARSGDVNIAYQVTGDGPFDVVHVPAFLSHVELAWQVPGMASFERRMASFSRSIRLDKRGTGMSDRVSGAPTLETRMDDVRAVMDAVGSERAAVIGASEGGPMSVLFAATYPDRVWALVLVGSYARVLWAPDYPWGYPEDEYRRFLECGARFGHSGERRQSGGKPRAERRRREQTGARHLDPAEREPGCEERARSHELGHRRSRRAAVGPHSHPRPESRWRRPLHHRRIALSRRAHPGARHVELPGSDHAIFAGDPEPPREIERFLIEVWEERAWEEAEHERVLATVLFTDIVGSTAKAAELGDARWRELIQAHHGLIRRQLVRFRGSELDTAGDGFFASFDGPARAIRCAWEISSGVRDLGIEVRAGLHTGECERIDRKVGGIAVNIGARVAAEAGAGEVLVSSTVKDLVAGSGIEFRDRGSAELKGVPGEWRLFAVERLAGA